MVDALKMATNNSAPLSKWDDKKSRFFREDVEWYDGITAGKAKLIAEKHDSQLAKQRIISAVSPAEQALGIVF